MSGAGIAETIERWHRFTRGEGVELIDLIHPDCVFHSPVVFTPQRGREITMAYLQAAVGVFAGDGPPQRLGGRDSGSGSGGSGSGGSGSGSGGSGGSGSGTSGSGSGSSGSGSGPGFRYVAETLSGDRAVLEFETTIDGIYINGVDIITIATEGDQAGTIVEFKVMVRPLQAVNLLHQLMKAQLERA